MQPYGPLHSPSSYPLGSIAFFFWWTHPKEELYLERVIKTHMYYRVKLHSITAYILNLLLFTATNSSTFSQSDLLIVFYHFPKTAMWKEVHLHTPNLCINYFFLIDVSYKRYAWRQLKTYLCLHRNAATSNSSSLCDHKKDKLTAKCLYYLYFQKSVHLLH